MKNFKPLFSFIIILVAFSSCQKESALHKLIQEADVVKVYISSGSTIPMVHYETNDIDKIKMWKNYIDEKSTVTGDCAYEGKLIFKVYEDSTEMKFSLQNGCEQVSYKLNDTLFVKKLTGEGIRFLNSLKQAQ